MSRLSKADRRDALIARSIQYCEWIDQGMTQRQIAKAVGLTYQRVSQIAMMTREGRPYRPPQTSEVKFKLAGLWAQGKSTDTIAKEMGISRNAVVGLRFRMGLESRPSPIIRSAP